MRKLGLILLVFGFSGNQFCACVASTMSRDSFSNQYLSTTHKITVGAQVPDFFATRKVIIEILRGALIRNMAEFNEQVQQIVALAARTAYDAQNFSFLTMRIWKILSALDTYIEFVLALWPINKQFYKSTLLVQYLYPHKRLGLLKQAIDAITTYVAHVQQRATVVMNEAKKAKRIPFGGKARRRDVQGRIAALLEEVHGLQFLILRLQRELGGIFDEGPLKKQFDNNAEYERLVSAIMAALRSAMTAINNLSAAVEGL